jgi:signal transduction histidine kinase/CheY-like chemotaxis protein
MPEDISTPERQLLRFLFENTSSPTVVLEGDDLVLANRAAREMTTVALERLFDGDAPWSEDVALLRSDLRTHGAAASEITVPTKRGASRTVVLEGVVHGSYSVITVRDVTEPRSVDAEIRRLRQIESVGQLTASVVHDFNNLLTPIACLSALLERSVMEESRALELARDIRSAAERASTLVRQVLTLARREPARPERVCIATALGEIRNLVERLAGPGIEVEITSDGAGGEVNVDREALERVVLNLVANARDAMPDGGRLTLSAANVVLGEESGMGAEVEELETGESYVALTVADTGVGMSIEVREKVLEGPFSTKAPGSGTGLGLSTARRFAAESGGCIAMHSGTGRGTVVALYLPRLAAEPGARTAASGAAPRRVEPPGASESVLVVEDDALVRGAVRAVLEDHGYRVHEAASGEEALVRIGAKSEPLDLLISDVVLPGMSGCELARRARYLRPLKVLLMSGHTARVLEKHGISEDDADLLRKAFTPAALSRKVREVLDRPEDSAKPLCG